MGSHTRRTFAAPLLVGIPLGFAFAVILFQANFIAQKILTGKLMNLFGSQKVNDVRLICVVTTHPVNHKTQAIHVKNTWGARCDKLIFMSSVEDKVIGAVGLQKGFDGRDWLFGKSKETFKYLWDNHKNDGEWFLKADDDTYVVVENLKSMLRHKNPNEPVYYGAWSKHPDLKKGFLLGGSGYVLSRAALQKFAEEALPNREKCPERHDGPEDVLMATCLTNVGVAMGNTQDEFGRDRFLHRLLDDYLLTITEKGWENKGGIHYTKDQGLSCCSDKVVSFHYVTPTQFYVLEYLLYHVKVEKRSLDALKKQARLDSKAAHRVEDAYILKK